MPDHITAYQIPKHAPYECIRGEVFPRGHSRHAYRGSESVDTNLGQGVWIFGCYHSREGPASNRVAGWEAIREGARTMRPESSGAVSFIRSLPVEIGRASCR